MENDNATMLRKSLKTGEMVGEGGLIIEDISEYEEDEEEEIKNDSEEKKQQELKKRLSKLSIVNEQNKADNKKKGKHKGKISPESYRKICEEMSISPADNINDLISEIVSGKISELLEARNKED